jgi:hypothetical protein
MQISPPAAAAIPAADPQPSAERRGVDTRRTALLALLVAGALFRTLQYASNRSLWLDEALLVSSILERPVGGLLEPLNYGQTAPFGFLLLVKLSTLLLGTSEYVLRLVPFAAALAALALIVPVGRRYVSRTALPVAVALFALAPYLLYYAAEVKQYSLDVLVALLVLAFAADAADEARLTRGTALRLLAAGALGVWLSQPAVFMLGGTGLVLGLHAVRARDWRRARALAVIGALWLVSFAGSYLASRRGLADPEYMQAFWKSGLFRVFSSRALDYLWLPISFTRVFREPLGPMGQDLSGLSWPQIIAGMACFAAGAVWMWKARSVRLALLLAPLGLVLVASALRLYPFGGGWLTAGRVLMFLIPSFVFLMAQGADWLRVRFGTIACAVAVVLMLIPSATYALVTVPHARSEVKPLLEYAHEHRAPGDLMYVYYNGRSTMDYYGPRYGWNASNSVNGICARFEPGLYLRDLMRLQGRPRVWVLFVDGRGAGFDERKFMVRFLDRIGRRLDDRVSVGVSLYLYDLRPGSAKPGQFEMSIPEIRPNVELACRGPWGPR